MQMKTREDEGLRDSEYSSMFQWELLMKTKQEKERVKNTGVKKISQQTLAANWSQRTAAGMLCTLYIYLHRKAERLKAK